jgi:pimeloyl-ACP methyl ester carboxylesterase
MIALAARVMFGLLVVALVLYLAVVAALYFNQRRLLYHPNAAEAPPASVGLDKAERMHLTTADGETLLAWLIAPPPGGPMIVYLHGNGGGVDLRADRYAVFAAAGFGVLAVEYRGYGGSTGAPSETGLTADAETAYRRALDYAPAPRIVLVGESLGTGLAVKLAAAHEVGAVVLDSPYTSATDVAAALFWWVPVRWLIKDRFESDARIAEVEAPLLIVHGTADPVVPFRLGRRLFELAKGDKSFIAVEGAGHLALGLRLPEAVRWIAAHVGQVR